MIPLLYLLVGIVLGGTIGWFAASRRSSRAPVDDRVEQELRTRLQESHSELKSLREETADLRAKAAAAEASRAAMEADLTEARESVRLHQRSTEQAQTSLAELGSQLATARAELVAARQRLTDQQARHEENLKEMRADQARSMNDLREAFKALSADTLRQVQPEFLRLANETFSKFNEAAKGDLSQRQQSIATLVKPLEEQLQSYQQRLQQAESAQSTLLGELRKQMEGLAHQSVALSTETLQLRQVLSSNQARGRWGEETLRRVVEAAGMSTHCDFTEQAQADDSKPDLLVHLPGDRVIIVDAKVPDLDFLTTLDAKSEESRNESLAAHAQRLRHTIKGLADRDYPSRFPNSLDFVVLFLPAESLFSAALEGDRELMIWAQNRRILIATPTSLLAILRSVSVSWQQHAQTQNARAIALAAQELYGRVCKFTEHFERIRDGLEKASSAYNQAVGSYERQVRPSAERMKELGAGVEGKATAEILPLEQTLRLPPAAS